MLWERTAVLGLLLAISAEVRAQDGAPEAISSAEAVASAVLKANPELEKIEAQISALEQGVPQAGVWPDPMVGAEYSNVPITRPFPNAHPMAGVQLRAEQRIPWPGKTAAREAVARAKVGVARAALQERQNALVGQSLDLYYRLALARQLDAIIEEHVKLVEELLGAVRAAYVANRARQHDLLQLTVLRDRLLDDRQELQRQDRELLALLNAVLHRGPDAPIQTPATTDLPEVPGSLEPLVESALRDRPELLRLARAAQVEQLGAERAQRERSPDVTAWTGYRVRVPQMNGDPGEDFVSAGVSIPLPWFWNERRWGALARQHEAQADALEAERRALVDALRGQLAAHLARLRRAVGKVRTYEEKLVPAQRATIESILASYRVGKAEFAALYQAELALLDFERGIRGARNDAARAATELATLAGANNPSTPSR